ncbi:hypothetical protein [Pedobacter hiemivivus]|uniref:Uncharacterized protein n=1 Tax=Pedobacter hiemivivus TaxID=2530454 RepID=A0A4R0NAC8_9SPHI|nr:hypothetical protein [Pedobacter hiemivivus]TCC97191.1 hypothetical protein EZ444_10095 [Pedobacter hiemivivus]
MTRLLLFPQTIYLSLIGMFLFTTSCKQTEESKIKEIANQYMQGRIKLKSGDTLQLKSVTEPLLFRFIKLTQEYLKIVDAPIISEDISRISAGEVKIDGEKATCRMIGHDYYLIHLIKTGDSWKVNGENNEYMTVEKIAALRKKIADQIKFKQNKPAIYSVIKVVNLFFEGVREYVKDGNISELEIITTPDTRNMIQKFYNYAKQRSGEDILSKEIEKFNLVLGDVTFESDQAEFKFSNESRTINLTKQNNHYKISGLEGLKSSEISQRMMADNYLNLLRALKLVRGPEYRLPEIK